LLAITVPLAEGEIENVVVQKTVRSGGQERTKYVTRLNVKNNYLIENLHLRKMHQ
jgi:hypothetical protein